MDREAIPKKLKEITFIYIAIVVFSLVLVDILSITLLAATFEIAPPLRQMISDYFINYTSVDVPAAAYAGLADFSANMHRGTMVCRHINIFRAVIYALDYDLDQFYIVSDGHHLRTYVNGTFIDKASENYKMEPTFIVKCILESEEVHTIVKCYPVYFKFRVRDIFPEMEIYDPAEYDTIKFILKNVNNKTLFK